MWPLWLPTHPSTLPHERQNFRAFHTTSWTAEFSWKKLLNKKCMVWFFRHLLYETFLILRTERDVITNAYRCLWRYELLSSYFKQLNWLIIFSKHLQISNFIKIHSGSRVVPCGYTDGRTDGRTNTKPIMVFAILRKCLKKGNTTKAKARNRTPVFQPATK